MINYLKTPNIPSGKVVSVLVDFRINPEAEHTLTTLGITVYKTQKQSKLYEAVSGHADMVIFHSGGNRFIVSPENADFYSQIPEINVLSGNSTLTPRYPDDIAYNAARVGKYLIHNLKYTDAEILKHSENLVKINVSQGYAKCSVCVINEKAIITSDAGIYKAVPQYGIDALLIDDEQIKLPGISHGFFGGSTGLIAPDILAVNGDIRAHKNHNEILDFCSKYGVSVLSLHKGEIEDIGSILPLTEFL